MASSTFAHAPASKVLFWSAFLCTGTAMYLHAPVDVRLPAAALEPRPLAASLARLAASQIVFRRTSECFVGMGLLFALRHVERLLGARQYSSLVLASTLLSATAQLALLGAAGDLALASGPFAAIFALLVYYYAHVPALPLDAHVFPQFISNKLPVYSLAAYLTLSGGRATAVPALTGFLAGILVKRNLASFLVPASVSAWFRANVEPLVKSSVPPTRVVGARPNGGAAAAPANARHGPLLGPDGRPLPDNADVLFPGFFGGHAPVAAANLRNDAPPPPEPVVDEAAVDRLIAMGFARPQVLRALRHAHGNVQAAANALLNHES